MTEYVLDASAVLAVINEEPGSDQIEPHLQASPINAVNLSEVVTKLHERGFDDAAIDEILQLLALDVRPFGAELAVVAGKLRGPTRHAGLSLGDRACLAFGQELGAVALTTDRAWLGLEIGIGIEFAR